MNIYKITRTDNTDGEYDVYVAAVVYAVDARSARLMHPYDGTRIDTAMRRSSTSNAWPVYDKYVKAELIGQCLTEKKQSVVLYDFRAG
jgi:hypothetical protein